MSYQLGDIRECEMDACESISTGSKLDDINVCEDCYKSGEEKGL